MVKHFDEKGGRRTIGAREQALEAWADQKARDYEAALNTMVELHFKVEELAEFSQEFSSGVTLVLKAEMEDFFKEQKKGESNGQTMLRLFRSGVWKIAPIPRSRN